MLICARAPPATGEQAGQADDEKQATGRGHGRAEAEGED
jgi:hypothetical protein